MLVDFSAQNFRSLRDTAILSFVATPDASHRSTHCLPTDLKAIPWITRGAAIYGANASGKSNLLFGLATMSSIVRRSTALTEAQFTEFYTPFRLEKEMACRVIFERTLPVLHGIAHPGLPSHHFATSDWDRLARYRRRSG